MFWQSAELPQYTGEGGPHSLMSGIQQGKESPPKDVCLYKTEIPRPLPDSAHWA